MIRTILSTFCLAALAPSGCGPMPTVPLPARLDDEQQKKVEECWDKALTPPGRLDHQLWLDLLIGSGGYQHGVDKLAFRSEKQFPGGLAVMEIAFDRRKPDADRFSLQVFDPQGRPIRREDFTRAEIEESGRALFPKLPPIDGNGPEDPKVAALRAESQARWKRIEELFPKPDEAK